MIFNIIVGFNERAVIRTLEPFIVDIKFSWYCMRRRNNIAAGEGRREEGDGFSPLPARNPKKETTGGGGGRATNEENVARKKTEVQHAILPTAIEPVANFLTQCLCWFAIAYAILEINDDLKVSEIWDILVFSTSR